MRNKDIYWIISWLSFALLLGPINIILTGCVTYEYTDPSGAKFKANTFLKDINADKISVSAMDDKGNGKTFDISKYQSDMSTIAMQWYQFGFQAGKDGAK